MKKILWLVVMLATTMLFAGINSVHVFQPNPSSPSQAATAWVEASSWYKLQAVTGGSYTSASFNAGAFQTTPWNGLLGFELYVDTVKTTTATDITFHGKADTLMFFLEKQAGLHWAVVDTIEWRLETSPTTVVERILAANNRLYYYYLTTPTSVASDERPLEGMPNPNHRIRVVYGKNISVTIKLIWWGY